MKRLSSLNPASTVAVICACLALVIALSLSDIPAALVIGVLGVVGILVFVFSMLSKQGSKEETVPDWHVALIFKKRRFQRQTEGPTFRFNPDDGESFTLYDLREQSLLVQHKCSTADQDNMEIKINVLWQYTHKDDIHRRFLKESNDSEAALVKAAKSIVSKQIAMRDYQRTMADLKSIEAVLKADLPGKTLKYGIQINDVGLSEPSSNEATSQLITTSRAEAKRIHILNDAVAKTSDRTIDYILKSKGHVSQDG